MLTLFDPKLFLNTTNFLINLVDKRESNLEKDKKWWINWILLQKELNNERKIKIFSFLCSILEMLWKETFKSYLNKTNNFLKQTAKQGILLWSTNTVRNQLIILIILIFFSQGIWLILEDIFYIIWLRNQSCSSVLHGR